MPRHQAVPDPSRGPVAEFAYELYTLRVRAGEPSYRAMAAATHFSHTSLSRAAQGRVLPSWEVTEAFVRYCGPMDVGAWRERWERARDARDRAKTDPAVTMATPASSGPPEPNRVRVVLRTTGTQQRRVFGTSARPAGAHRGPGRHRRHDDDAEQPEPLEAAAERRRAQRWLVTLLVLVVVLGVAGVLAVLATHLG